MILTLVPTLILVSILIFLAVGAFIAVTMWSRNEKLADDYRQQNTRLQLKAEAQEYELRSLKAKLNFLEQNGAGK